MKHYRIEVALSDPQTDLDGRTVLSALHDLGLTEVQAVRTARVYAVSGALDAAGAERLARDLFADKVVETYAVDTPVLLENGQVGLDVTRKPGVMDPVQVSALKGARELGIPVSDVRTARRYLFTTTLPVERIVQAARKVIANDVIEDVLPGRPDLRPRPNPRYAFKKVTVPLRDADDRELERISRDGSLYLSRAEMRAIQEHFRGLGRDPTDVELETIAQTWSEHCIHKTLRGPVRILIDGAGAGPIARQPTDGPRRYENLLKETIVRATEHINAPWCLSVFKDNAGVIAFDDENENENENANAVCFKVETHNHPSALEPYGGAGTGLGGVIRDVLGTGLGARPIAGTDVFCFGPLDTPPEELPPGTLHPKRVMKGVVAGVRDYGNRMGIPTVGGAVLFDARYLGNPLVYCGTVGILPRRFVEKEPHAGDLIVVAGGRTGRDGIHGATFSSGELTEKSESVNSGAVQIGNAIEEKKLLEAILTARDENLFTAITDCGAGGLSSAVGEMGIDLGAEVHLEKAPLKYDGLSYTEIWISEAQERMVLSVPPEHEARLTEIFASEQVEAVVIGRFTDDGMLRLFYEGKPVGELELAFLHGGLPRIEREAHLPSPPPATLPKLPSGLDRGDVLRRILAAPNVCSKEWVIRQYDHEVQAGTIIKPLVGAACDGPSDAAVIAPVRDSTRAVALGHGINPCYGELDPYRMAASAIDEAVRNVICVGARFDRIALLDNFSWGNTDKPDRLGALVLACEACRDVAMAFGTPFISGKDSLNNEYQVGGETICIPHTLLISAIGIVDDYRKCVTMDAKAPGNRLFLVGQTKNELGGSHLHRVLNLVGGTVPDVDLENAPRIFAAVSAAIAAGDGIVRACHDLSEGGLAVAAAEMAFAGGWGIDLDIASLIDEPMEMGMGMGMGLNDPNVALFSESNTRFLLEVAPSQAARFRELLKGLPCVEIGEISEEPVLRIRHAANVLLEETIGELKTAWRSPLEALAS